MLRPLFMCFLLPLETETIIPATFVITITKPLTKLLILCHHSGQAIVNGQISRLPTSPSSTPWTLFYMSIKYYYDTQYLFFQTRNPLFAVSRVFWRLSPLVTAYTSAGVEFEDREACT